MLFSDFSTNGKTVRVGKHDVENRQIGRVFRDAFQRVRPVVKRLNAIAVVFQIKRQKIGDLFFVVNDEDLFVHRCSFSFKFRFPHYNTSRIKTKTAVKNRTLSS